MPGHDLIINHFGRGLIRVFADFECRKKMTSLKI